MAEPAGREDRMERFNIEEKLAGISRSKEAEIMHAVWIMMAKWFVPMFVAFGVMIALLISKMPLITTFTAVGAVLAFGYAIVIYHDSILKMKFAGKRRVSAIYSTPFMNYFIDFIPEQIESCKLGTYDGQDFHYNHIIAEPTVSSIDEIIIVTPVEWNEATNDSHVEHIFHYGTLCPIDTAYVTLDEMKYVDIGMTKEELEKKLPLPVAFMGDCAFRRKESMKGVRRYPSPDGRILQDVLRTYDNFQSIRLKEQLEALDGLLKQYKLADRDVERRSTVEVMHMLKELHRKGHIEKVSEGWWEKATKAKKILVSMLVIIGAFALGLSVMALLGAL